MKILNTKQFNEKLNIRPMTKERLSSAVSSIDNNSDEYRQSIVNLASDKINNFLGTIKTTEDVELFYKGNIDLLVCDAADFSASDTNYYSDKGSYPTKGTNLVSYKKYDNSKYNWVIHTILFFHITPNGKQADEYHYDMFTEFVDDLFNIILSINNDASAANNFSQSELFDYDGVSCFLRLPAFLTNVNNISALNGLKFKTYLNNMEKLVHQVENAVAGLKSSSHYIDYFRK